ncbi:flagellar motor switch protein FliN [Alishewanella sp. 16-MA]|uniref:Flagellar motor switch protein FliN n=1 Tax=Alishewanella maricola TaxID=2795740 RepID=A0ABS8C621_9ALTE|nr:MULTISPECIES: flagellar motor switch protein FliN [Alishewanella]MDP4944497.1 flagellar motor switch protein FliN [Alishewanella sp.]MCB5227772.1 flagellar motor switch protein FliN [Alishewanella maricola]MDP5036561.1 flagellar motor switch protein FliN [Alishewanella sp.]MDP5186473.1 flagellar motor switch protein FliN [Alishewanella sp.]MDP5459956.1 flagellar motor switch protein FliN [Alishewanella sp. SMS8]
MAEDQDTMDEWAAAMAEAEGGDAKKVDLEELKDDKGNSLDKRKLDTILDIPVTISMEVGRAKISIRNLLQLNQGSVVELERIAGEPLDVLVNGTLIAHGEVVVVNDKFGIRLTDVISQIERIKKLR